MLQVVDAIVLHSIKYTDNSLIITAYTKQFGRASYIVNLTKKGLLRKALFSPLNQVEIEIYARPAPKISRIKNAKLQIPYHQIPTNIVKSTIVLFCAEVLYKTLQEGENDVALYEFLCQSLLYLDHSTQAYHQFHLIFLIKLMPYLGFSSVNELEILSNESHPYHVLLGEIQQKHFAEITPLRKTEQKALLAIVISQYKTHFLHHQDIKSLKVLQEVFG